MLPLHITNPKQLVYRVVGMSTLLAILGVQSIVACDTPVYRYAMYRWEPAPYEIYYFHEEPIAEQAAKLHEQIQAVSRSEENPANVIFIPVPLKEDTELKRVPPDVKKGWLELENPTVPTYMVVTPHGGRLHLGDLDEAMLKSLLDSPARGEVAKQLEQGKAGVLLLLTGADKKATAEAEKAAKSLIKDIADGKIELYMAPAMFGPPGEDEEDAPKVEVGYHKVQRDDPKEKWLVESLLSIESDLKDDEFVDTPMVFGIFGRGRALPPFVGKGINPDNLLDCVDFVTGACSCTVKDQNPGMDLLFTKDWWEAAETLANQFGAEEGNEAQYGPADFFPQLMIPSDEEGGGEANQADAEVAAADEEEMSDEEKPAEPPSEAKPDPESGDEDASEKQDPDTKTEKPDTPTKEKPDTPPAEETAEPKEKEAPVEDDETAAPAEKAKPADQDQPAPEEEPAPKDEPEMEEEPAPKDEPDMEEETTRPDDEPVGTETIITSDEEDVSDEEEATAVDDESTTGTTTTSPEAGSESPDLEPETSVGIMAVGVGIAVALLLLFALTFAVLRPK
jgi:hypothetical protein